MQSTTIFIVDDAPDIQEMLKAFLFDFHAELRCFSSGEEAIQACYAQKPSVVIMDVQMPGISGLEAMEKMKTVHPDVPFVIITGAGSVDIAVKAMQQGVFDYLAKPFSAQIVRDIIQRALKSKEHTDEPAAGMAFSVDTKEDYAIVGMSKPIQEVFKLIGLISTTPNQTSVLITGESGTGKELIARAIHANSGGRANKSLIPLVPINCTAIPENLLESELFGAERGAYTGAVKRRIGKFESAGEGTIFLDEIGDLSAGLQAKLLRVLQERVFERVGGDESLPVRARFITATHRNLENDVRAGKFREDLFYRLNVAVIHLPPLRGRREDIPLLTHYFLSKHNARMGKSVQGFTDEAYTILSTYSFPGNVRELENMIERAVMLTTGPMILAPALGLKKDDESLPALPISDPESAVFSEAREQVMAQFEERFVKRLLSLHRGNVSAAADASQMSRQNFHRLMQKYSIQSEMFRYGG